VQAWPCASLLGSNFGIARNPMNVTRIEAERTVTPNSYDFGCDYDPVGRRVSLAIQRADAIAPARPTNASQRRTDSDIPAKQNASTGLQAVTMFLVDCLESWPGIHDQIRRNHLKTNPCVPHEPGPRIHPVHPHRRPRREPPNAITSHRAGFAAPPDYADGICCGKRCCNPSSVSPNTIAKSLSSLSGAAMPRQKVTTIATRSSASIFLRVGPIKG
jgi:hypothetical protein